MANNNLFTRFSSYYNKETSPLSIEDGACVMLSKGVGLDQTQKKVEFLDTPKQISETKKIIGKITYTYDGKEVGGSEIYYENKGNPI